LVQLTGSTAEATDDWFVENHFATFGGGHQVTILVDP
jgi:hypothetical protein